MGPLARVVCAITTGFGVLSALASAQTATAPAPPGANDFSRRPSAAHPNPVVLLHGLSAAVSATTWSSVSPQLAARGYCVFTLNFGLNPLLPGVGGLDPIEESAAELATFVDGVLASTGAAKVDLVGASEGTFMLSSGSSSSAGHRRSIGSSR